MGKGFSCLIDYLYSVSCFEIGGYVIVIARYYNVDGSKIACNLLGGTDMIHPETFKFLDSSTLYRRVETKEAGMEKCRQCAFQHERMLCNAAPRCGQFDEVNVYRQDQWTRVGYTTSHCYFVEEISMAQYEGATVENMEI